MTNMIDSADVCNSDERQSRKGPTTRAQRVKTRPVSPAAALYQYVEDINDDLVDLHTAIVPLLDLAAEAAAGAGADAPLFNEAASEVRDALDGLRRTAAWMAWMASDFEKAEAPAPSPAPRSRGRIKAAPVAAARKAGAR